MSTLFSSDPTLESTSDISGARGEQRGAAAARGRDPLLRGLAGVRGPGLQRAHARHAAQVPDRLPGVPSLQGLQHVPGRHHLQLPSFII